MAVRTTMEDLITRTRRLINDPGTGSFPNDDSACVMSNQAVQDVLDLHRIDAWYDRLNAKGTRPPSPAVIQYLDFYADNGNWEEDAVLVDASYNVLSPATSDFVVGHWTFSSSVNYLVRIKGKYYDLYGSAADLLEEWASQVKLQFTFGVGRGDSFNLSEKSKNLLELAERYRLKQWPNKMRLTRNDMTGERLPEDPQYGIIGYGPAEGSVE